MQHVKVNIQRAALADAGREVRGLEDNVPTSATFTDNKWRWGWTAGVGSEWAWTPNLSVKSEFLYMRFDQHDFTVLGNGNIGAAGLPYRLSSEDSVWVTRIGLNYRFGGWGRAAPGSLLSTSA